MDTLEFILKLLGLARKYDICDDLFWRTDNEYAPITFWINCNDLFWWGTADLEDVTPDDLPELERACIDATFAGTYAFYGTGLYCARRRKLRPQGACYKNWTRGLQDLYNECGPEREIDICNPRKQELKDEDTIHTKDNARKSEAVREDKDVSV